MEQRSTGSSTYQDFTVGPWYVQPSLNLITNQSRTVQLEPKVMQMLVILAERGGGVVSRDELHDMLWTDAIVTDKALTRLASELRKAFGDDARDPKVIATISKSGYRLVAPVSFVSPGDGSIQVTDPAILPTLRHDSGIHRLERRRRLGWMVGVIGIGIVGSIFALQRRDSGQSTYVPAIQLTSYPGHEIDPVLSPDGNEVAFAWQGEDQDNWDVYVRQPGSSGLLRLTDHPGDDLHPAWSPDGTEIAFVRFDESTCTINTVPALSGEIRQIAECDWIDDNDRPWRTSAIDWSPDGKWIATSDGFIELVAVDSGERIQMSSPPDGVVADVNPIFSPDGRRIAFIRVRHGASADLFLVGIDGSSETQVTQESRLILGHAWSGDGRDLVFSSNRSGRFGLWRIAASGGTVRSVPADGWNIEKVSVARNGRRMAYEGWIYDTNIWRRSVDTDAAERFIASTLWDRHPAVSPDGRRIAFVSNRSGSWHVWVARSDGGEPVALTDFSDATVGNPSWSPDGGRIAFQVQSGLTSDVAVVDTASGRVTAFAEDASDEVAPSWSATGEHLYFGSNRGGSWQVWTRPVPGGEMRRITQRGGYAAKESSRGEHLYYTRHDSSGLWRVPFGGGEEVRILEHPAGTDWGNWSLVDTAIVVLTRDPSNGVWLRSSGLDGGSLHPWIHLERAPSPHHPGFSISPDGRSVFLTFVDATESDLFVMDVDP